MDFFNKCIENKGKKKKKKKTYTKQLESSFCVKFLYYIYKCVFNYFKTMSTIQPLHAPKVWQSQYLGLCLDVLRLLQTCLLRLYTKTSEFILMWTWSLQCVHFVARQSCKGEAGQVSSSISFL